MLRRRLAIAGLLGTILATGPACTTQQGKPAATANPLPTIRLSPTSATTGTGALEVSRLVDRDTSTAASVTSATTITFTFGHSVEIRKVKVHGANVTVSGRGGVAISVGAGQEWASGTVEPYASGTVALDVSPAGAGARLDEIEIWGAGLPLAPRSPSALALATRAIPSSTFEDVWMVRADGMPATLTPAGLNEGSPCFRAQLRTGAPIRQVRRAYLAYEANVQRASVLVRSIDAAPPSGGFWLGATNDVRTLVDELDPERLTGDDGALLCLPDEATGTVTLDGLRLLLVTDNGTDPFEREARLALPEATDGDLTTSGLVWGGRLEATFERKVAIDGAALTLAAPASVDSVGVLEAAGWTELGGVVLDGPTGALPIAGRTGLAAGLTFTGSTRPDVPVAGIKEIGIEGSGVGPRVGAPHLVFTSPGLRVLSTRMVGERFDGKAFLSGWAESPQGRGAVSVDGVEVGVDGAFSTRLVRPDGKTGAWDVVVRARFPGGAELTRTIHLEDDRQSEILQDGTDSVSTAASADRFGAENQSAQGSVDPEKGGKITLGTEASVEVPPGAVVGRTSISITRKGPEVVPQLEGGMINVTAPAGSGYRFLPKGQKFLVPAKIELPYDPELLPEGVEPEEIRTYYFDEGQNRWIALQRRQVVRANQHVVSETTHFTFMINAVLVLPDHPGPTSFNPNSIKDLKAADPSAGMDLIEPPAANNQGSARVALPIRLPKARGAYQPSLGLSYDSGAGEGWVGVGWSLPVSSISLDTKFGVPEYTGHERYLLDGEQLVPMDGTAACSSGDAGQVFAPRVERSFRRILRCGADSTRYWFEVTDTSGVLYVFGYQPLARLASYNPRITVPPTNPPIYDIAEWFLERVVDTNGNLTEFGYETDYRDADGGVYKEDFRQVYLRDVWYTGYADRTAKALEGGSSGAYHVRLKQEMSGAYPATRPDVITSGRLGFKTMLRRRLGAISVELTKGPDAGIIREYKLTYEQGDFGKSRLKTIDLYGSGGVAAGKRFYTHSMEWESAIKPGVQAFANPVAWTMPPGDGRGIGSTDSRSGGVHFYAGMGIGPTKNTGSVGFRVGMNFRDGQTKATMVDVNGDGLPDRIAEGDVPWFNQAVPGAATASNSFSPYSPPGDPWAGSGVPPSFTSFPGLGSEFGASLDAAVQVQGGGVLSANFGANYNFTKSRAFLTDANGDGLVDAVEDGAIYLNKQRCGVNASCADPGEFLFEKDWVVSDLGDSQGRVDGDPTLQKMKAQMDETLSPEDVVLEWTAPYGGTIDLVASLGWANAPLPGGRHDGVRLRLYRWPSLSASEAIAEWRRTPDQTTPAPVTLHGLEDDTALGYPVFAGEVFYFVLSTLSDNPAATPLSPEEIAFAPVITYATVADSSGTHVPDKSLRDATGAEVFRFDATADMRLEGDLPSVVALGHGGTLEIRSHVEKRLSGDAVRMCVHRVPSGSDTPMPTHCPEVEDANTPIVFGYAAEVSTTEDLSRTLEVGAGDRLAFQEETDLSIDPATARWRPEVELVCPKDEGSNACVEVTPEEHAALKFAVVPYMRLHQGVLWYWPVYTPWPVPPEPYVVPGDVDPGTTLYFSAATYSYWGGAPFLGARRESGELLFKVAAYDPRYSGIPVFPIVVNPGDRIYFEGFSQTPTVDAWQVGVYSSPPTVDPDCDATLYGSYCLNAPETWIQASTVIEQPTLAWEYGGAPFLPGGYRGWRYGLWQGKEGEPFDPGLYRTPTRAQLNSWNEDGGVGNKVGTYQDPNSPERRRARLVGILIPRGGGTRQSPSDPGMRPDVEGFVSSDRTAFVSGMGTWNASRRSLATAGVPGGVPGEGEAGSFVLSNLSRSSVGVGISAGISAAGFGGSLGAGINQQKTDVLDMNGDRIVDVVAAGGLPDITSIDIGDLNGLITDPVGAAWSTDARITDGHTLGVRRTVNFPGLPRLNIDVSGQVGLNVSDTVKEIAKRAGYNVIASALPGAGVGFDLSTSLNDLQDVNGDGLPDMVRRDFSGRCAGFLVRLNFGTSFAHQEDCVPVPRWGSAAGSDGIVDAIGNVAGPYVGDFLSKVAGKDALRKQTTLTVSATMSGAIVLGESFGASAGMDTSLNSTSVELVDVTGDGLPDYVLRDNAGGPFYVMVNLGYGFASPTALPAGVDWPSTLGGYTGLRKSRLRTVKSPGEVANKVLAAFFPDATNGIDPITATGTHSTKPTFGATATFSFPLLLISPPFIYLGGGIDVAAARMGGFELGLQDVNGDGFADHVLKTGENGIMMARINQLAGGNLLKTVKRPLGGSFDVHYSRTGNTVDMPESRWVMDQVTVRDGRTDVAADELGHALVTSYAYAGGRHDRYEREFLGFAAVKRTNPDASTVAQTFLNEDFRVKGLLASERFQDKDQKPWIETVNTYGPQQTMDGAGSCSEHSPFFVSATDYCTSFFTPLAQTETRHFEGRSVPGIVVRKTFDYDPFGNVHAFHDWGDVADAADDVVATIDYDLSSLNGLHFMDRPIHVVVRDGSGNLLRERNGTFDPKNGNLLALDAVVGDGRTARSTLTWYTTGDALGMLESVTGPENLHGDHYAVTYKYDQSVTGSYPTSITDVQGYGSEARYNERYGEPTTTTDVNHQVTERQFDDFGRLKLVAAPGDTVSAPTISLLYVPEATVPHAVTTNRLPGTAGVKTVVLMDGLQRAIQTKKTAEVSPSGTESTVVGWSVTGHQRYDAMGRVAQQGQTFFQSGSSASFVRGAPKNPSAMLYDVMGRALQVVEPNGATSRNEYGFGSTNASPALCFKTTTIDAMGKAKVAYQDAAQRTVAVEERVEGRAPTTLYAYNPTGELVRVTDARGNATSMTYDLLGRRTTLNNPDAGLITSAYDTAGHLTSRTDAKGQTVTYDYAYDQLISIHYPVGQRDVTYAYGLPDEWTDGAGHVAGRVKSIQDAAGAETRKYDQLGAVAVTTRTVKPLHPGDTYRTFTTAFSFDAFGRMMGMVYPDGETLAYTYDAGGLLKSATGTRPPTKWTQGETETYLKILTYDEFGQRVFQRLGNNVETTYTYEPLTRRLHGLRTITPRPRLLQALEYAYDLVGNVTRLKNDLGAAAGDQSGGVTFAYGYDDLHRLTYAHGEAASRAHTIDRFTATYAYDDIHNMQTNVQLHEIVHGDGTGISTPPKTNHAWSYEYAGVGPHQATKIGDTFVNYDQNGNTVRECRTQQDDPSCSRTADHLRRLYWTEENRLDAVIDGGGQNVTSFVYDAAGDRVVKLGRGGEAITIGQFWSLKGRRAATKHIFAGATRLASKLLPPPGWDETALSTTTNATTSTATGLNDSGCDPSNYQPQKCQILQGGDPVLNHHFDGVRVKPETYYYHPDHLGSTSWVTDQYALVREHVEYFPYGEVWRDPQSDADRGPVKGQRFLFTSKEMDEETGLYYFGARYYEPRRARWISPDPLAIEIARTRPMGLAAYNYAAWTPVIRVDPDGLEDAETPNAKEWPLDQVGTAAWKVGWKEWKGSVVAPSLGERVSLGGKSWSLGSDPYLDETLVKVVEQYDRMAMTRAASWGLLAADAVQWVRSFAGRGAVGAGGSIRNVNTGPGAGRTLNCANCAVATDATLGGRAASALPGGATSVADLTASFGKTASDWVPAASPRAMEGLVGGWGSGARGVVFGARGGGELGHFFNVVNQRGVIRFLDGQAGGAASLEGFERFFLLRTH